MKLYFVSLFVLMAAFFLIIGVKVVTSSKPIFLSSRIFFVFMVLCFSPQLVNFFTTYNSELANTMGFIFYINPIIYTLLIIFFWFQLKGYIAIGIYDESFRGALHSSLNKQKITFEEQLSLIKLTSVNASLQVAVQSWVGTAQIKLKKSDEKNLLKNIIVGMEQYFLENNIKSNNFTAIFYVIMGLIMIAAAAGFAFSF